MADLNRAADIASEYIAHLITRLAEAEQSCAAFAARCAQLEQEKAAATKPAEEATP